MPVPGEVGYERQVSRVINGSWVSMRHWLASYEAQNAVRAGQTGYVVSNLPWDEWYATIGDTTPPIERMILGAVRQEISTLPAVKGALSFQVLDAISIRYGAEQSAKLIKNLSDSTRATVRHVIADAMAGKHTVDTAARALQSVVGLHPAWADAVIKHGERAYARAVKDGADEARALAFQQKQVDRYAAKLTRTRAMNIARTETQTASNLGRWASWEHAIQSGYSGPGSRKEWSPGPGACPLCSDMSGEIVGWDAEFSNGANMPPAHPGCRCTANLLPDDVPVERIDWLSPNLAATYRKEN